MKILVVGSGGRESTYVWKLQEEGHTVFCAPGNAGIENTFPGTKVSEFAKLAKLARHHKVDLTLVGPEAPLVSNGGIANFFAKEKLFLCGPTYEAAMITEGSKVAFKNLLLKHGIPTAPFRSFSNAGTALQHIEEQGPETIVIKADGLAGGKGACLPNALDEAIWDLEWLAENYPHAMQEFIVEHRYVGTECSVVGMTDGRSLLYLPVAQDYKRRFDGDRSPNPNTGGMGAYTSNLPRETEDWCRMIVADILRALRKEGIHYQGFMYVGFMLTKGGPKVLEMNCRGPDPETQAMLTSIEGNFGSWCMAMATGNLGSLMPPKKVREAVCVNLVDKAYPEASTTDAPIYGIAEAQRLGCLIFHGATGRGAPNPRTNKAGRVLSVVGTGQTVLEAQTLTYKGVDVILSQTNSLDCRRGIAAGA